MKRVSFPEVERCCESQGAVLHESLGWAARHREEGMANRYVMDAYAPSPMLRAVRAAGALRLRTLVTYPQPIATAADGISRIPRRIEPTERIARDTPARTLLAMINAALERWNTSFQHNPHLAVHTCAAAEPYFVWSLTSLNEAAKGEPVPTGHGGIIVAKHRKPILWCKAAGEQSALTLQDETFIDGVPYPAGSLVAVKFKPHISTGGELVPRMPPISDVASLPFDAVDCLGFMRLSLYALRPEERAGLITSEYSHGIVATPELQEAIGSLVMDDVYSYAEKALSVVPDLTDGE